MKKLHPIVMLSTEKASRLVKNNNNELVFTIQTLPPDKEIGCFPYFLHILSDEKIKKGDWMMNDNQDTIVQCKIVIGTEYFKKIIATSDKSLGAKLSNNGRVLWEKGLPQIPESFLPIFVKTYNEGNPITEVELEYFGKAQRFNYSLDHDEIYLPDESYVQQKPISIYVKCGIDYDLERHKTLKITSNNEVIISLPREKPQSEIIKTQKELIELLEHQVEDLCMVSKIELGDDVIEEIKRLRGKSFIYTKPLLDKLPKTCGDLLDKEISDFASHGINSGQVSTGVHCFSEEENDRFNNLKDLSVKSKEVELPEEFCTPENFTITVGDSFCKWEYPLNGVETGSIESTMNKIYKCFNIPKQEGKLVN